MPIVIEFIKTYWKQFAIAGLVMFLFLFGYYRGYEHEKAKYEAHLNEDARLTAIAKAENDLKIKQANQVTENITKEYADAVAKINAYYKSHPRIISLCNAGSTTSSVSTASQSTSGVDATTNGTAQDATQIDLQKAAQEIEQCQMLIKFEQEQESIQ